MLIATYFKRPTAPVNLPCKSGGTKDYFFTPVDPSLPESEHVADVTDPHHIQLLLAITHGYYVAEANASIEALKNAAANSGRPEPASTETPVPLATAPAPAAGDGDATAPDPAAPAAEVATETQPPAEPEAAPPAANETPKTDAPAATTKVESAEDVAAKALLALPLAKFKAELKTTPRPVLAAALAIESDKGNDERATVVKHLKAALA